VASELVFVVGGDAPARRRLALTPSSTAGVRVVSTAGGDGALAWARALQPDLVVAELATPQRDGCALARRPKADPVTRGIPTVAVASDHPDARSRALDAGFDDVVVGPFTAARLADRLGTHLIRVPRRQARRRSCLISLSWASASDG
jgi:CheY-like chemotaxis protein